MARRRGPFRGHQVDPEASGTFLYLNSNKRSVVLDLSQAAGRARLEELVRQADLLLHNFTPQEMAANGLDYAHYRQLNARLVMLSITPFGLSGPHRDYAACDLTLYHGSGLGWLCPGKGTPLSLPPIKPFGEHAYTQAALHGAVAAMAACYGAADSGVGEHLDLSVQEVGVFYWDARLPPIPMAVWRNLATLQPPMNPNHSTLARMATSISSALSRASGSGWSKSWASRRGPRQNACHPRPARQKR